MKIRTLAFLLLGVAAGAHAADPAKVSRYLDVSGINDTLDRAPVVLISQLAQGVAPDAPPERVEAIAHENFSAQAMRQHAIDRLAAGLDDREIDALLAFAASPFAQQVTALERQSAIDQPSLDVMLAATRPLFADPERLRLAQRLDAAAGLTDFAVAIGVGAITGGLAQAGRLPSDPEALRKAATAVENQVRPTLQTQLQQQMLFSLLYTYRSLDVGQWRQYVEFAEQPASRHATTIALESLRDDILQGLPGAVSALVALHPPQAPATPATPAPDAQKAP